MAKPGGNVTVTTEVGYCPFCGRTRNLRREERRLGGLVRATLECESCHRTLSSTMGPVVEPPAESAAPPEEKDKPSPEPSPAEPERVKKPAATAKKPAAKKPAAAAKTPAAAAKKPAGAARKAAPKKKA